MERTEPSTLRWQRRVLLATLVLGCLVVLPAFLNPIMLPKATVLVLGAVVITALGACGDVLRGRLRLPASPALGALLALVAVMAVVTVFADDPGTSLLGRYSRHAGAAAYAAYAVLLVAVVAAYRGRRLTSLTAGLLGSLVAVLAYGTVQLVGADPLRWSSGRDEPVFSFMGNTNYASAYVGILVPLVLAAALQRRLALTWRASAAALVVWALVYVVLLRALQGPIIAVVGMLLVVVAAVDVPEWFRRAARAGTGARLALAAGAAGTAVLAVAAARLVVADLPSSLHQRTQLWTAAWRMFLDRPVLGTGLDGYGDHFLASRPIAHATERGLAVADAAHQVPLSMFAHGGALLGAAWVAFVVLIGVALVRGLRRTGGDRRVLLAGYGGSWLAYQVQSLVSLDVPPVAVLHFVTAGAVLVLAEPGRVLELRLPPLPRPASLVAAGLLIVLAVSAVGQVVRPLRADANAALAIQANADGDVAAALDAGARALRFNPVEPSYQRAQAKRIARLDERRGLAELVRAAEMEAGSVTYAEDVVALAAKLGEDRLAQAWREEQLRRDPYNVRLLLRSAERRTSEGRHDEAERLLQRALEVQPRQRDAYVALADAQLAQGDREGADRTYARLAARYPSDPRVLNWQEQGRAEQ